MSLSWVLERARYQRIAEAIEPAARVVTKDSWLWTALWIVGVVLTLGILAEAIPRRRFLDDLAVTVAVWQGYSRKLERLSERLIAHESRHSTQTIALGWALAPLTFFSRTVRSIAGLPFFAVAYFLLLPAGLAVGRFYLELDADRAAWRLGLREGWMTDGDVLDEAERRAEVLSGRTYLWAWPRTWALRTYERTARAVIAESGR